jgi:hypothetical protein
MVNGEVEHRIVAYPIPLLPVQESIEETSIIWLVIE